MTSKADITKTLKNDLNITMDVSHRFFDSFLKIILNNVSSKKIKISKFGTLRFKYTPERVGRNPKNGDIFKIDSMQKLSFHPSSYIKKKIN